MNLICRDPRVNEIELHQAKLHQLLGTLMQRLQQRNAQCENQHDSIKDVEARTRTVQEEEKQLQSLYICAERKRVRLRQGHPLNLVLCICTPIVYISPQVQNFCHVLTPRNAHLLSIGSLCNVPTRMWTCHLDGVAASPHDADIHAMARDAVHLQTLQKAGKVVNMKLLRTPFHNCET